MAQEGNSAIDAVRIAREVGEEALPGWTKDTVSLDERSVALVFRLMAKLKLNQTQLAVRSGIKHRSEITRILKGGNIRRSTLEKLAHALETTSTHILAGEEPDGPAGEPQQELLRVKLHHLPVFDEYAACGDPTDGDDTPAEPNYVPLPADAPAVLLPRGFGIRTVGNSMEGLGIVSGGIAWAVPPDVENPVHGKPVVAYIRTPHEDLRGCVVKAWMRAAGPVDPETGRKRDCLASAHPDATKRDGVRYDLINCEFRVQGVVKSFTPPTINTFPPRGRNL